MSTLRKFNPLRARFVIFTLLIVIACAPLLSRAHAPATTLTIVNNSSREIRHVYLSPPDSNNWGPDQLGSSVIAASGGSITLNASCDGTSVKVIAEDHEGCFFYNIVACGDTSTWTISSGTTPDCGN